MSPAVQPRFSVSRFALVLAATVLLLVGYGCSAQDKPKPKPPRYTALPAKTVPAYLKGSILEYTDVMNAEPYLVSGYGLVVGLHQSGGNRGVPPNVYNYMIDEMVRHGFDKWIVEEKYKGMKPEHMLAEKSTAIVTVVGAIPPGARKKQRIDVAAYAFPDAEVKSLSRGRLYRTELRIGGANPLDPKGSVNVYGYGEGRLFVNPAYAVGAEPATQPTARASLRSATVMDGGFVVFDRPLWLRLRQPEYRMARSIQMRIMARFEDSDIPPGQAQDEGIVHAYVPARFRGDWEHFIGVVTHLYLNGSGEFSALKARELVEEARKPQAPLADLSYCWEGLGPAALPYIQPLYVESQEDLAFAAARAGAFIGDATADEALLAMARDDRHPFQLNAVKILGALPASPRIERMLEQLMDSSRSLVRIEAYRILADRGYYKIHSLPAGNGEFAVDLVPSDGPPLIYATRTGPPRIALFGRNLALRLPMTFSAMNHKLTISSRDARTVNVYYRGEELAKAINVNLSPELPRLIAMLADPGREGLKLSYGDVIGLLQSLADRKDVPATFVLQDAPQLRDALDEAPPIPEQPARPQGDEPRAEGQ